MRNKYLLIVIFLITAIGFSQPIEVSVTQYTPEQLIKDILINNPCAQVSNVSWSTGTNYGVVDGTGIGYFSNANPNFDMDAGIILSTGNAKLAEGPESFNQGVGNNTWLDDTELTTYMNAVIGPDDYHNATVLEFDFVPFGNSISFNFIFASEEYGGYQCDFSDAFAFFLTNTVTNATTNLALVPGTGDPISVTTIRDEAYNGGNNGVCSDGNPASMNEEYFDSYNAGDMTAAINFLGQTVKMVAQSTVIPMTKYHIKLVIQDRGDSSFDSGVFIEAGSFDMGSLDLGDGQLVVEGNGLCAGDTYTLNAGMDPLLFTYEWYKNGTIIPNQSNVNLVVTETGYYHVKAYMPSLTNCTMESDPVLIEFYDYVDLNQQPSNLQACMSAGGMTRFDLNDGMAGTTSNPKWNFSYYLSQNDANNDVNEISNLYDLANSAISRTIWVRVYELNNPCAYVTSFSISLINCIIELNPLSDLTICEGDTV
ncbi:MAG TPA: choice-of-anchor L domain-containing protein, partial [Flavobacterium sp.]|nr:choice-of-anchor L domain-containing protein [Flavobacterium sp.]